uniref:Peptidase C39-like domain-containing protein n=1 Tax=Chromera velia CCMP2878 TaxID=1169474 RepID=A0A0G4GXC6_9ALVE|eukprot:Cvel_23725.t1-p1 / transcript=Cvel_23725.t1 / gene=Cvel_23725 / organism=Chromera_velia_CCMP2878 / gene_product=hypothetical protein / transcript_product=hypothetical protein / location=Cvel_scaffold2479:18644-20630(+) / protein_length=412 / sequence_SO=supercontig / SO=protein_coding / is_pseudo=false
MSFHRAILFLSLLTGAAAQGGWSVRPPPRSWGGRGDRVLDVQQRFQWQTNYGYCGEVSLQIAAMYWGTWVSAWTIREMKIAQDYMNTRRWIGQEEKDSQYVIRDGEDPIIAALHLQYSPFASNSIPAPQYEPFMVWMKRQIQSGSPVIFATFVHSSQDEWYDHIAVGHGILSDTVNDSQFRSRDVILWSPLQYSNLGGTDSGYTFGSFSNTRRGTDGRRQSEIFQVPRDTCFGIAISGHDNWRADSTRVSVEYEPFPDENYLSGCNRGTRCFRPDENEPLVATVHDLTPGQSYTLLRFDGPANLPSGDYCASNAFTRRWDFTARGTTHSVRDRVHQLDVSFFRAVSACRTPSAGGRGGSWDGQTNREVQRPVGDRRVSAGRFRGSSEAQELVAYYFSSAAQQPSSSGRVFLG